MDTSKLCLETSALIAYLKGREPGASAVERAVRDYDCHVPAITVYELLLAWLARKSKSVKMNFWV